MKRKVALLLVTLFIFTMIAPAGGLAQGEFIDIVDSSYKEAIMELLNRGIVSEAVDGRFRPDDLLTRAEAAALMVRAFKLPEIHPLMVEENVEKKFTYDNPLGVIDEGFVVHTSDDIIGHWGEEYIEGLIKVRAISTQDNSFGPQESLTREAFLTILGKVLFGVEEEINYIQKLKELNIFPQEFLTSKEHITRGEAADIINLLVSDPDFKVVTLLATTDIHGHIEPYMPSGAKYAIGGMAKMQHFVEDIRNRQPNTILVDIGDAPYNTNVTNLFEGKPVIEIMNMMGYDAMAIGNHDFDFPFNVMERNANDASFPFLSANTYYNGEYPEFLKPYIIKEVDGIKFGILGLTDDSSAWYTHPNNVKGITFKNHFESAKEEIEAIRDQVDVIIALSHLHGDNKVLPIEVEGIDFVMGGGTDVVAYPEKIADSWLISSGKHAELVSQTNMNFLAEEMVGFNFSHVFMTENLEEDQVIASVVENYTKELDEKLNEVVAETKVLLDGERGTVRLKESNLANVIADSLRDLTGADVALQNGGGVRASINAGDISIKDIYTALPFDNTVVVLEATGKTLWDTLEHGISAYPGAAGQFLQVSGINYTFDASKEPGSRLVSVMVNGEELDMEKTYTIATNDFLSGGGDKFTMLLDSKTTLKTKSFLRDSFREYLLKNSIIEPQVEGRITILNEVSQ